jgi:Uma2 family endonuclease
MTMIATLRPLTYEDLQDMPDDGQRYEVIGGELIVTPAPSTGHQRVLRRLFRIVDGHAQKTHAGETFFAPIDVLLGRNDAVEPDLVFLLAAHDRVPDNVNTITFVPDLVVEVVSPCSRRIDNVRKMALYARAGIAEYWIADPERRIFVINVLIGDEYVPLEPDADGQFSSRVLAGLKIDPVDVFADLN